MENPEEILHSLEEFAKMKPKDIPRELEEYLKFVAKTGDPVYQWSSVKSLFREKLINVITEFYESCSSVEIPPCPNVEMFNYELMKNFILEKLDTFPAAPFTLQRICELLTSPRKEYTRIDKYMRALEKNILVVSTMEPGGRRTENGDGVMNGIESDHEHVPEPGNEINVEEMDDTPSWHQNIQTNNHVSEPITFENPEHEYHVSSTNQEIVCVQYVSVEPLQSEGSRVQNDDNKDDDISVTITAVDDKKDDEIQGEPTVTASETQRLEGFPKEPVESSDKSETETGTEPKIDPQTIKPPHDELKDTSKDIDSTQNSLDPLTESILSQPTPITEPSEVQAVSLEPESIETENISPEISVTSSESSPPTETLADVLNIESVKSFTANVEEDLNIPESHENKEISETDIPGNNSNTEASKDVKTDSEEKKETEVTQSEISKVQDNEASAPSVEDTPQANIDSSSPGENSLEVECNTQEGESPKIEISNEVTPPQNPTESKEEDKEISDRISSSEETTVIKPEASAEPDSSNVTEEKVLPMEVDGVPDELTESDEKEKPVLEKGDTMEPPA